jgi:putative ABC transport system substrate-binding protein
MRRREFITLLGGAAAAWPMAARGQQMTVPMIGFLSSRFPGESAELVVAFRRGIGSAGFAEGQNIFIAFRWAEGHYERLPGLAAELVDLRVAVILAAGGAVSALAAKAATATIPIVFSALTDPVGVGLIASLSRPGGNVTGMSSQGGELGTKRLGLLHELVPTGQGHRRVGEPEHPNIER